MNKITARNQQNDCCQSAMKDSVTVYLGQLLYIYNLIPQVTVRCGFFLNDFKIAVPLQVVISGFNVFPLFLKFHGKSLHSIQIPDSVSPRSSLRQVSMAGTQTSGVSQTIISFLCARKTWKKGFNVITV